ncbi:hypothetical protein WA026_001476 [Henosepilachna vigintioctopunctata]|uniref:Cell cycle checkpoint protein RAD17 n=1 Tax=Henosepilachna vigintioctopunctata TaxID=420089 RepID=A0AAW1UTK8_9CUCU
MKNSKWKSFDFGPNICSPKRTSSIEILDFPLEKQVVKATYSNSSAFDFHSKLTPKVVSDLAVHSKKIEEVKLWLENVFSKQRDNHTAILLLSGPTGSGKTATLNVLCKDLDISISEWVNPVDQDYELLRGSNQMNTFIEFITTESKYTSLFDVSKERKIVLVEDFPNLFLKKHDEFSIALEECYYKSKHPIVFICTDVANNKINLVYNLFPQEELKKYQITHIGFNACAPTLLKYSLKRAHDLVQKHKDIFQTPPSNVVEAILLSSMGDIRCAINQYYFACLLGTKEMPTEKSSTVKPGSKRKRSEKTSLLKIMARDETLGLFHALGRILNPKRKEYKKSWRLNCDIESLITELESQPENVISFLFSNCIKYFGNLKELCDALDLLCLSQTFFEKWTERKDLHQYPLWISVLGLMMLNNHKVSKWNQIEGIKKLKQNIDRKLHKTSLDDYYSSLIKEHHMKKL